MTAGNKPLIVGMPNQNAPLIDRNGMMTVVWYRFFQSLFIRSGLNTPGISLYGVAAPGVVPVPVAPAFYVGQLTSPRILVVLDLNTGHHLGDITMDV